MIGRGTIFGSRVAAIRYQVRVLRFRFGLRKSASVICHRPSHPIRVAAPGGRWQDFSIQPSIQPSIQSSTQSSIQPSVIDSAQPEAARSARSADPTLRQCPEMTKNDVPRTKNSLEQRYVVTRSRPYPMQTRSARGAAPTQGQALPLYSILHTRYSLHSAAVSSRWSWNRAWKLSA